jgi:conjugal transfer mating pair stabilization protein TraG
MGGGAEGRAAMANWLKGGFEMDRKGNWRLKPQIADTIQRDVQAIMAQTGWERSIGRAAQDQNVFNITSQGEIAGTTISTGGGSSEGRSRSGSGLVGGSLAVSSQESGTTNEAASSQLSIVNYDVRQAIANAEYAASKAGQPADAFTNRLTSEILGPNGLRNRNLGDADSARGTTDLNAPVTSFEQSSLLYSGRFSTDLANGPTDGDGSFKKRD